MPSSSSTKAPKLVRLRTLPLTLHAGRVLLVEREPRIRLDLLEAERDLLVRLVHLEHHGLDDVADVDDLGRMPDVARPRHLGDVDQALDALLELDECAVVGDRDDLALDAVADLVLLLDALPRVGLELLQAERDALLLGIEVEHLDPHLVADLDELGRMRDAAPRHVGDVEQAVDAAQVHERAEVGDVLDHALADLVLREVLEDRGLHPVALLLEHGAARDHDVPAALVELDDLDRHGLAEQRVHVLHLAQRDLRAGQERLDAVEVHHHAALDLADQLAFDHLPGVVGLLDAVPDAHEVGALLGEHDQAVLVLHLLEEDVDDVADLDAARDPENSASEMTPSLLKPTSTSTSLSSIASTVPRTISPSPIERSDSSYWPNISARCSGVSSSSSSALSGTGGRAGARRGVSATGLRVVSVVSSMGEASLKRMDMGRGSGRPA